MAKSPSRKREGLGEGVPTRAAGSVSTGPPASGRGAREAIARATTRFAVSATARLDAELLMAHALGVTREDLLLRHLDAPEPPTFAALVERRARHEPIAYITGTRAFWTIDIAIGPGALVPRADSETLIEAAVAHFDKAGPATILDLGTGPGTLLLAALAQWPNAQGIGIDRSPKALAMARINADRLGLPACFVLGDWAKGIDARFDLILANPPYIAIDDPLPPEVRDHEPAAALFAGPDGLDAYHAIALDLPRLLASGGVVILEIGATQASAVTALLEAQGLSVRLACDLAGHPRALIAG